ncbi:MAG TPA: hypothetical protein PLX89_21035, partial [Verrucomicrobiota bacterium]|nr:hypothetical protein [Verrucomicrobiota bacterium]
DFSSRSGLDGDEVELVLTVRVGMRFTASHSKPRRGWRPLGRGGMGLSVGATQFARWDFPSRSGLAGDEVELVLTGSRQHS